MENGTVENHVEYYKAVVTKSIAKDTVEIQALGHSITNMNDKVITRMNDRWLVNKFCSVLTQQLHGNRQFGATADCWRGVWDRLHVGFNALSRVIAWSLLIHCLPSSLLASLWFEFHIKSLPGHWR